MVLRQAQSTGYSVRIGLKVRSGHKSASDMTGRTDALNDEANCKYYCCSDHSCVCHAGRDEGRQ